MSDRSRPLWLALVTVSLSLAMSLGLLELGLRLVWTGYHLRGSRGYLESHDTRGWSTTKGTRTRYGSAEFATVLENNSQGFRGPEIEPSKAPGRVRVLILGDSMTYGLGVENAETFSSQLARLEPRVEAINAGVPGYSSAEQLLLLREDGLALAPDLVLVAFFRNDIGGLKHTFSRFSLDREGVRIEPPVDPSVRHPLLRVRDRRPSLVARSYLYRFTSDRLRILRYSIQERLAWERDSSDPPSPAREALWRLELGLLREIAGDSRRGGAEPAVVVIPDQIQVDPSVRFYGSSPSVEMVQPRLAAFGRDSGVPVIDLLPGMRERFERDGAPLYHRYDRHLNRRGHAVVAEIVLHGLRDRGLLPGPEGEPD